jgi:hypothetical protein
MSVSVFYEVTSEFSLSEQRVGRDGFTVNIY